MRISDERREAILGLYLMGASFADIVLATGFSPKTVSGIINAHADRCVKEIKEWKDELARDNAN